jgi:hypothetical protein
LSACGLQLLIHQYPVFLPLPDIEVGLEEFVLSPEVVVEVLTGIQEQRCVQFVQGDTGFATAAFKTFLQPLIAYVVAAYLLYAPVR